MPRSNRTRLGLNRLDDRLTPTLAFAAGSGVGVANAVRLYSDAAASELSRTGTATPDLVTPFAPGFAGGVRVAVGDVTGDGIPDAVAGAGPGGGPAVAVFDGVTLQPAASFFAFAPGFSGGVSVAVADVTGDGVGDVVVGAGAGGGPAVKVFDGRTFSEIASFFAFTPGFTGGVSVAAADVDLDGHADVVVGAGAGGGPAVRVFDGRTFAETSSFFAFAPGFTRGVRVAAGDLGGDGRVEIAAGAGPGGGPQVKTFDPLGHEESSVFAGDPAGRGGAVVAVADLNRDRLDDLLVGDAAGNFRGFDGRTGQTTLAASPAAGMGTGVSLGGALSAATGGSGEVHGLPNVPVLQRFGRYNPATLAFDPVAAGSISGRANVYVLVHGWAPGYASWVEDYYFGTNTLPGTKQVLKVWQTDPSDPNFPTTDLYNVDGLPPASEFLFDGMPPPKNVFGVTVSTAGLAATITEADPSAVVLAYSWIDESATDGILSSATSLTGDVNLSEAHTTENGLRLAQGLQQILAPNFAQTGLVHLLGHSHGSKVATVAALELQNLGQPAEQLTTLDSPEDTTTQLFEAANFNWYFLRSLNVRRDPAADGGTFVDNYVSEFGESYSNIGSGSGTTSLANVVDSTLYPGVIYPFPTATDVQASHSYAATWYAGTTETNGSGGLAFSPLLHPAPTTPLAAQYEQAWDYAYSSYQYTLDPTVSYPPAATVVPQFHPISFPFSFSSGNVSGTGNPSVTLSDSGGTATWVGNFNPTQTGIAIAFDYQFSAPGTADDQLTLSVDGNLTFAMTGSTAGTGARTAILSTGLLHRDFFSDDKLRVALTGTGNAAVTVGNFRLVTL